MKPQMSANASLASVRNWRRCVLSLKMIMMNIKRDVLERRQLRICIPRSNACNTVDTEDGLAYSVD